MQQVYQLFSYERPNSHDSGCRGRISYSRYARGLPSRLRFKVLEGSTADEAVAIIEDMDTQIDLVLTDIRMPGSMDGFGLVRWISANRPDINFIMASGEAKKADPAKEHCENTPLFEKPYNLQAVVSKIRATIEASQTGP